MRYTPTLCLLALAAALIQLPVSAQAPPAGYWDLVLSGDQQGIAHLLFEAEGPTAGTIRGRALFTFSGKSSGVFTNRSGVMFTNGVGGAAITGKWSYSSPPGTNRILGFLDFISVPAGSTNVVTNGFSFRGLVSGPRMNLLAVGYRGTVSLRGIPLLSTNDLSGTYHGTGQKVGAPRPFVEVFVLTPVPEFEQVASQVLTPYDCSTTDTRTSVEVITNDCLSTNLTTVITITQKTCLETNTVVTARINEFTINNYNVEGAGPANQYTGNFMVSRQRYAAFYQQRGLTNDVTVYAGPFNPSTGRGTLIGTDGRSRNTTFSIYHGPR